MDSITQDRAQPVCSLHSSLLTSCVTQPLTSFQLLKTATIFIRHHKPISIMATTQPTAYFDNRHNSECVVLLYLNSCNSLVFDWPIRFFFLARHFVLEAKAETTLITPVEVAINFKHPVEDVLHSARSNSKCLFQFQTIIIINGNTCFSDSALTHTNSKWQPYVGSVSGRISLSSVYDCGWQVLLTFPQTVSGRSIILYLAPPLQPLNFKS